LRETGILRDSVLVDAVEIAELGDHLRQRGAGIGFFAAFGSMTTISPS
jgi:hypothetical protein